MVAPDSLGPTLCLGEILVEIVASEPGYGFTEPLDLIGPFPSGAPAIFIDQCARMGCRAAMIGAVGQDDFGRVCIERLARDGVNISAIASIPELPTGTAFVRYRPDGERDFVFNMWTSAAGRLSWNPAVEQVVARSGHLHVMGTLLSNPVVWPIIDRAAAIIKKRGGSISLDPNIRKELCSDTETQDRFDALLTKTDVLLPSGDELLAISGFANEALAVENFLSLGIAEVVVKRGAEGSTAYTANGDALSQPAFAVKEVDPTGAGDCFGGAYIAARRLGSDIKTALRYAASAGARNVTYRGPMEGAGTRADLDAFIEQNGPRA
ncbi:MAG: sugar kinase [Pseudomonadota bacterium]